MQTKSLFLENISIIVRLIQVYANNTVFTPKIRLFLYKIAINCLSSPFFMLCFISIRSFFLLFSVFAIYNNVCPKYCQSYKKDVSH